MDIAGQETRQWFAGAILDDQDMREHLDLLRREFQADQRTSLLGAARHVPGQPRSRSAAQPHAN